MFKENIKICYIHTLYKTFIFDMKRHLVYEESFSVLAKLFKNAFWVNIDSMSGASNYNIEIIVQGCSAGS